VLLLGPAVDEDGGCRLPRWEGVVPPPAARVEITLALLLDDTDDRAALESLVAVDPGLQTAVDECRDLGMLAERDLLEHLHFVVGPVLGLLPHRLEVVTGGPIPARLAPPERGRQQAEAAGGQGGR